MDDKAQSSSGSTASSYVCGLAQQHHFCGKLSRLKASRVGGKSNMSDIMFGVLNRWYTLCANWHEHGSLGCEVWQRHERCPSSPLHCQHLPQAESHPSN